MKIWERKIENIRQGCSVLVKAKKLSKAEETKIFYNKFIKKYKHDANGFATHVLKANPSFDQIKILKDVSPGGGFFAYSSGHHTGKSFIGGTISHWMEICYPESQTYLAADKESKIKSTIWKEVHRQKVLLDKRIPAISRQFTLTNEHYYNNLHKASWFVKMKATGDVNKADTNFSGLHAIWLTLMLDEASGIADAVFDAIDGTATKETNRVILFSQRTKNVGRMHDAFGKLSKVYKTRVLDTEESPLVKVKEIKAYRDRFGGRHTDQYRVRVKGLETRQKSGMLLSRVQCEELIDRKIVHKEPPGYVLICDPSGSGYRDKTGLLIAKVSGNEDKRAMDTKELREIANNYDSKKHTMDTANEIAHIYKSNKYPNLSIGVDFIGIGHGVCHKLTELNIPHTRIQWFQKGWWKDQYRDLKMEGFEWIKEAVDYKRISFIQNGYTEELMEQLDRLPFDYNDGLKYMLNKEKLQKLGIPSPDYADCYSMGMILPYIPVSETVTVLEKQIQESIDDLSWMERL